MVRSAHRVWAAGLVVGLLAMPALADWDQSALGKAKFGAVWSGSFKHDDLRGKVVVVKAWADW